MRFRWDLRLARASGASCAGRSGRARRVAGVGADRVSDGEPARRRQRPCPRPATSAAQTPPAAGGSRAQAATLFPEPPRITGDDGAAAYHAWGRGTTAIQTDHELFNLTLNRSLADLRLLINDGPGEGQRYVAAGVPWFATLFGRDAVIASFQALAFRPQIAMETLEVLAAYQATEVDDWRDAEPGKILHELRTGEMAGAGELPHTPYYGSVDSTPLWLILLRRHVRLDGRPGVRRPALAERPAERSTGSTNTAIAMATASSSTSADRPAG